MTPTQWGDTCPTVLTDDSGCPSGVGLECDEEADSGLVVTREAPPQTLTSTYSLSTYFPFPFPTPSLSHTYFWP